MKLLDSQNESGLIHLLYQSSQFMLIKLFENKQLCQNFCRNVWGYKICDPDSNIWGHKNHYTNTILQYKLKKKL